MALTPEQQRLRDDERRIKNWKRWGPYLSERQWGTVREDYSPDGSCWNYLPHDHARSRAYRWGEDGLLGISDRQCRLCFAFAFWNERDPILKERLFGLTGPEGNNGEDVKECYYYLEALPTHSYLKALYKYPQGEFPYRILAEENKRRRRGVPEFELRDTGIFDESRYFDIVAEYAKEGPNDILVRLTVTNCGPDPAPIHILPTLWFRNTWGWGRTGDDYLAEPPEISLQEQGNLLAAVHPELGSFSLGLAHPTGSHPSSPLFTNNETNLERLFGAPNRTPFVKDAFHNFVINKRNDLVNAAHRGTKAAYHLRVVLEPGASTEIPLRLFSQSEAPGDPFNERFSEVFEQRIRETDNYYRSVLSDRLTEEERRVSRQAYAGLIWSKQFYFYSVSEWLEGDPTQPAPAPTRSQGRNSEWQHLFNRDVIAMPDKWEYPWYAAWDLAFHMIPFAKIDPDFAKRQLILFLREWYMHPNGQIPAYEFALSDVNPPVHAWACWRVYKMTGARNKRDRSFLARCFHKLLLNFTWWVNRKDVKGNNLFSGGFLGLDNIGVFDRGATLPTGGHLEQADATAWMGFYCGTMLNMALELASEDPAYADVASKFFEHFVGIIDSINHFGGTGLWDQLDGFYYDRIQTGAVATPLRVRSLVGIIPLIAVEVLQERIVKKLPGFAQRMDWFLRHRSELALNVSYRNDGDDALYLLAIPSKDRLVRMLHHVLDEAQFLSPFGLRSLSKIHGTYPYVFYVGAEEHRVDYAPGESNTAFFGGNSNWRGPVWFPINYLVIEALERYHYFYGDDLRVEYPSGSGVTKNLLEISQDLAQRLSALFLPAADLQGGRPCHGDDPLYKDSGWNQLVLFYEFFHGDNGKGLGASHQTGWTALVTRCFDKTASARNAIVEQKKRAEQERRSRGT